MNDEEQLIETFGSSIAGVVYTPRRAAYAVIKDDAGRIAAVGVNGHYFLPGGGALTGETPEATILREVREELARPARLVRKLGQAIQYFFADGTHYRMEATFYIAEFTGEATGDGEHQLTWLEPSAVETAFFHQSHAGAARQP
jgi:8-oxo-dGTP pyrophosphatase MutT (NUDIX family)